MAAPIVKIITCLVLCCAIYGSAFVVQKNIGSVQKANDGCPEQMYNSSMTMKIYSPNYPNNYDNNQDCLYQIIVPDGNVVQLHFTTLFTEFKMDKIDIYDGDMSDQKLLGSYSGAEIPDDQYSTGNVMTLHFTSDPTFTYQGFSATYTATSPPGTTAATTP